MGFFNKHLEGDNPETKKKKPEHITKTPKPEMKKPNKEEIPFIERIKVPDYKYPDTKKYKKDGGNTSGTSGTERKIGNSERTKNGGRSFEE